MGQIADEIKHICGMEISSAGCEKAELAIKSAIAKLGRGLIREYKDKQKTKPDFGAFYEGRIVGIKELLRRINKM